MPSEKSFSKLKSDVATSKAIQEDVLDKIKSLQKAISIPFAAGKLSFKDFNELMGPATAGYDIIAKNNLQIWLDKIAAHIDAQAGASIFTIDEVLRSRSWIDILEVLKELGFSLNTLFEKPLPTVAIGGTVKGDERVSRTIDNLLYSYTPYKLRGIKGNYSILLLPSQRGDSIPLGWYTGEIYAFHENGVKVITPDEIRLTRIEELRSPIFINGDYPFKLEISRDIADATYYCRMGFYISYKRTCQRRECPLWSPCQGKRFWSQKSKPFQALVKVVPNINVRVDSYSTPKELVSTSDNVFKIEKIDDLSAKIYVDAVVFLSRYLIRTPIIRPKETIGYRVHTKSVAFSIEASWLRKYIKNILENDEALFNWIYTKYFILNTFDVNDVRGGVTTFFWNLINSTKNKRVIEYTTELRKKEINNKIILFACDIFLHTLSHILHQEVVSQLQTASDNIIYSYSRRPDETDGRYRIFLFENAEGGLGLTESYAAHVTKIGTKMIENLINRIMEIQVPCYRLLISPVSMRDVEKDVKTIWDHVNHYNQTLQRNYGIFPPVEITRYILSREDEVTAKILDKPEVATFIDDILSSTSICWDGCYNCVRLETECHNTPYEQLYSVSKNLLVAVLNEWRRIFGIRPAGLERPLLKIGEARDLSNYMKEAKKSVHIISPWISKEIAESIIKIASKQRVRFEIITSDDLTVDTHKKALEKFARTTVPNVNVYIIREKLHAKMLIVDERVLVMGSANLTLSGLYENIESYIVLATPDTIKSSLLQFNELLSVSSPISSFKFHNKRS
jgi:hypothetical protein